MNNIKISLAEVSDAAKKIRAKNTEMYNSLADMKREINLLDSSWISEGGEEIRRRFNMFSARFEEHRSVIESYARFLDLTVSSYDTLETSITSNASGITY